MCSLPSSSNQSLPHLKFWERHRTCEESRTDGGLRYELKDTQGDKDGLLIIETFGSERCMKSNFPLKKKNSTRENERKEPRRKDEKQVGETFKTAQC